MARNIKTDKDRRSITRRVRLNEAEDQILVANAAAAKCKDISKFLRMLAVGEEVKPGATKDEKELVMALQNLAHIRRQMAERPEELRGVIFQIEFIANKVTAMLKHKIS